MDRKTFGKTIKLNYIIMKKIAFIDKKINEEWVEQSEFTTAKISLDLIEQSEPNSEFRLRLENNPNKIDKRIHIEIPKVIWDADQSIFNFRPILKTWMESVQDAAIKIRDEYTKSDDER